MTVYTIAEKALQAERQAKSLHESTQKLAVLAANADRRHTGTDMLCVTTRTGELIRAVQSLRETLRDIEQNGSANYKELNKGDAA